MGQTELRASQIKDGTIVNADIASNAAIDVSKLAGSASVIVGNKSTGGIILLTPAEAKVILELNNVTNDAQIAKSIGTTQGDIIYWTGANTPARLAKGAASQALRMNSGATAPEWANITVRQESHVTVYGEVKVPSGDTDYIPPFFVSIPTGSLTLKAIRYRINSGTSATIKLTKNGSDITGYTSLSCTSTPATTTQDATLADNDLIAVVVTAVSGTPKNMTVSLRFDRVV